MEIKRILKQKTAVMVVLSAISGMAFSSGAMALDKSLTAAKIDQVKAKGLTGKGVNVGQLELDHPDKTHPMLNGGWIIQNPDGTGNSDHATHVAGILMGQSYSVGGITYEGVAPGMHLQTTGWTGDDVVGLRQAVDWLMLSPKADIVNMSAGVPLNAKPALDVISDWAAAERDTLFVVAAGNEGWDGKPRQNSMANPGSGYNVLTVGSLGTFAAPENYHQVRETSSQGLDTDTHINPDIVAPGGEIMSAKMGGTVSSLSGTSFAAPHVAGTAALLHEYSTNQGWGDDSRDHKVLKSVLMNSADKSVKDKEGKDWSQSEAKASPTIALDDQLGAGGLNAYGAYKQYAAGEYGPGYVPLMGWDFFDDLPSLDSRFYSFEDTLEGGSMLTATLIWDRHVTRTGDTFSYLGLDDLDLWLWWGSEKGKKETRYDLLSSYGYNDTAELIYQALPQDGWYTLEVDWFSNSSGLAADDYALSWRVPIISTNWLLALGLLGMFWVRHRDLGRGLQYGAA